jgi:hypothetical protein
MREGVSMLFRPSALPMRDAGMWVADGTNLAMDLVLGAAILIVYAGICHNGRLLLAKWQNVDCRVRPSLVA